VSVARHTLSRNALKLLDLGLLVCSYGLATLLVVSWNREPSSEELPSARLEVGDLVLFVGLLLTWHLVFSFCGMYRSKRLPRWGSLLFDSFIATSFCTVSLAMASTVFLIAMVTLRFLAVFWVLSFVLVFPCRLLLEPFPRNAPRDISGLRSILILGTNQRALDFAASVESSPKFGYRILGFVDDYWPALNRFHQSGRTLLCNLSSLPEFLRNNFVDEIVNYLPMRSFHERTSQLAALCKQRGIPLHSHAVNSGLQLATPPSGKSNGGTSATVSSESATPNL
jgi:FlaA1/EpsC-like NDP-sugar epimerase